MKLLQEQRMFFLGAGSMGEAMIKGLIGARQLVPGQITVANRQREERLQTLRHTYGVRLSQDRLSEIAETDILVLAVKPFDVVNLLREIAPVITSRHLIISVAAGITTATIEACLTEKSAIVRAMPNASSFVQESATALCYGQYVTSAQQEIAQQIFASIGTSVIVPEEQMDAVTGLSGSGPAYFYYIVEALLQAGQENGLSAETSRALLLQTMHGAIAMLQETGKDAHELRRQVTSPNGTTMAGITVLDQGNGQQLFAQAVKRATERAVEMGTQAQAAGPIGASRQHRS